MLVSTIWWTMTDGPRLAYHGVRFLGYSSHLVVVLVLFAFGRLQRGHFWADESRHKIMNYP